MAEGTLPQNSIIGLGLAPFTSPYAVKIGAGRIYSLTVLATGGAGSVNDCLVSGAISIGNQTLTVPASAAAGTIYPFPGGMPHDQGIWVVIGSGAVYALAYS